MPTTRYDHPSPLDRIQDRRPDLAALAGAVRTGRQPWPELVAAVRRSIDERDRPLGVFTQVFEPPPGPGDGPLSGLPVAVKDNIDVGGHVTGQGRPLAERRPATADAEVVRALGAAGAWLVGKTNLPEFSSSAVTVNATFGAARNPAAPERTAGGSSGGSAVAVAAGLAVAALGTDTAGSVLLPAALTGISGFRPTHGTLSTGGVARLSPTLDTVGLMTRRARDLPLVLRVLTGTSAAPPAAGPTADVLRGLRIGVLRGHFREAGDDVLAVADAALERLRGAGAAVVDVELAEAAAAWQHARTIYRHEAAAELARVLDPARRYAPTVEARRIAPPTDETPAARDFQRRWRAVVAAAGVDLLACPAAPAVAPPLAGLDAATEAALLRFTYPLCLAGVPVCTVPAGRIDGLPAGLMLAGRHGADLSLAAIAGRVHDVVAPPDDVEVV